MADTQTTTTTTAATEPTATPAATEPTTTQTQTNPTPEPAPAAQQQPAEPQLTIDSYKDMGVEAFDEQYRLNEESLQSFKELGLSKKISPEHMKTVAEWTMQQIKAQNEAYEQIKAGWRAENEKKYGENLKNVKTNVGRVLADFDKSGEFAKVLQTAGVEDNPAALEFLAAVGDAVLEKGSVNPNASAEGREPTLEDMYK